MSNQNLNSESSTVLTATENAAQPAVTLAQRVIKIQFHLQNMGQSAIIIGQELIECKKEVPHGEWQNWLEENFNLSYQTAAKFMQIAERFGNSNVVSIRHFNSTQLIALLALPADETEKFIEEHAAAGNPVESMTVKQTRAEVKKWKDALKKTEAALKKAQDKTQADAEEIEFLKMKTRNLENIAQVAVQDAVATIEENEKLQAEIEQLKNQPPQVVEVTKEVIPADYESAKQSVAELQSRVAELQAQGEEAQKTIEDLQNQVFDAVSQQGKPKIEYVFELPEDYQALQKKLSDTEMKLADAQKDAEDARAIVAAEKYIEQLFSSAAALNNSIHYHTALKNYMKKHPDTKAKIECLRSICNQLDIACDYISE